MLNRRKCRPFGVVAILSTLACFSLIGFAQDTLDQAPGGSINDDLDGSEPAPDGFVLIQSDTFEMGSSAEPGRDGDETEHAVTLTRDFFLQRYEVTQVQWQDLMGTNPSHFANCGDDCPVEMVSWYDALRYANTVSRSEGLDECYVLTECWGQAGEDLECDSVNFNGLDCEGYRLPTEAEWEYAARAGTTTPFYSGSSTERVCDLDPNLDEIGWYCGNSNDTTHPVGRKTPNDWGLYDMAGNVGEWCSDWFAFEYYASSPSHDPLGPESGRERVRRGGSWGSGVRMARSADRSHGHPSDRHAYLGFRLARTAP